MTDSRDKTLFPDYSMWWANEGKISSETLHVRTNVRARVEGDGLFKDTWYVAELSAQFVITHELSVKIAREGPQVFEFIHKFLKRAYEYSQTESPTIDVLDFDGNPHLAIRWEKDQNQRSEKERITRLKEEEDGRSQTRHHSYSPQEGRRQDDTP